MFQFPGVDHADGRIRLRGKLLPQTRRCQQQHLP